MLDCPVILIDSNNACWRAAHSVQSVDEPVPPRSRETSIAYGMMSEMSRAMERFRSPRVLLCGDHPDGSTLRKELFPEYKQKRTLDLSPQDLLFRQKVGIGLKRLRNCLRAAGYQGYVQASGYEADDLIAAFCNHFWDEEKVIVSTDHDLFQLLDGKTVIHRPGTRAGLMTLQEFYKTYGITPTDWVTVKALAGCTSDNVPGCAGIGEYSVLAYLNGKLTGRRLEKIEAHVLTPQYQRDRKLVTVPFDDQMSEGSKIVAARPFAWTEVTWRRACRLLGITLPYPL